jgi:hypothetical protein
MTLVQRLLGGASSNKQATPFFDLVFQTMTQHVTLPTEQQETIRKIVSLQYIFGVCAQHLNPKDLMMVAQILQDVNTEGDAEEQEEIISKQLHVLKSRLKTDPTVTITYFVPDSRKAGGTYRSVTGAAKKVDEYLGILEMSNGITIPFDDILSLE